MLFNRNGLMVRYELFGRKENMGLAARNWHLSTGNWRRATGFLLLTASCRNKMIANIKTYTDFIFWHYRK